MYLVLVYDIKMDENGPRVLRRVFKTCKRYLTHIQASVFEGEMEKSQIMKLECELKQYLRKGIDSCIVFKSRNNIWLKKEFLVEQEDPASEFI